MALNKCIEARSAHAVRDLAPRVGRLSGCGIRTIALIFDPWRGQQTSLSNNSRWMRCAITPVGVDRATVGANISRLNTTGEQLGVLRENLSAASSRIKDTDVAEESTQFARYSILVQAGTAMLAQANATTQSALRLLQ